jgi:hypothetical protein
MKKTFIAVLHLKYKEPLKVYQLGGRVITSLTANKTTYATPDPTVALLTTENNKLDTLIKSKDGSKQKNQAIEDQTVVVYNLLKTLVAYVNKIANGDRATILLSGFDSNDEASEHDMPGKVIVKRIEDGSTVNSAKIYIEPLEYADRYKVEISSTPNDSTSWKTVLDPASLNHIEITNLTHGQELYIRVTGGNTHGWGIPSDWINFIPR